MKAFDLPDIHNFRKKPPRKANHDGSSFKISDKIDENYKIASWSRANFKFEKIDVEPITKSLFLMEDEKFKELVSMIINFNKEIDIARNKGDPNNLRNGPWRSQFHLKLYSILREITLTKNRMLQKNYLDRAFDWANETKSQMDAGAPLDDDRITKKIFSMIDEQTRNLPEDNETDVLGDLPSKQNSEAFTRPVSGVTRPTTAITRPQSSTTRPLSGLMNYGSNKNKRPLSSNNLGLSKGRQNRPFSAMMKEDESSMIKDEETMKDDSKPKMASGRLHSQQHVTKQRVLPSQLIEETLSDYKSNLRTQHLNEDPPDQRLKNFKRKVLVNETEESEDDICEEAAEKLNETTKRIEETISNYGKMPPAFASVSQEEKDEKLKIEQEKLKAKKEKKKKDKKPARPGSSTSRGSKKKKKVKKRKGLTISASKENLTLEPANKPFQKDPISIDDFVDRDTQLNHNFQIRSNYINYVPSEDQREKEMEELWLKNRHKEIADKRSDEEFIHMMKLWSKNKERVEIEISRKIQSAYEASQFEKCEYKPKEINLKDFTAILDKTKATKMLESDIIIPKKKNDDDSDDEDAPKYNLDNSDHSIDEEDNDTKALGDYQVVSGKIKKRPFSSFVPTTTKLYELKGPEIDVGLDPKKQKNILSNLEKEKAKLKISQIRKTLGKTINADEKRNEMDFDMNQKSMSVYSNGSILPRRPFSAIIERNPARLIQRQQLDEVDEVKNRLAQYKTSIPADVLTRALVIPDVSEKDTEGVQIFLPVMCTVKGLEQPEKKKTKRGKSGSKKKKKKK